MKGEFTQKGKEAMERFKDGICQRSWRNSEAGLQRRPDCTGSWIHRRTDGEKDDRRL